ncbi:hypothetical protein CARUB_v10028531mg [Capsella rubella]|uniref:F-box associated beta-propeller type 3 domain-containing protein n=1 Tax=Capsella rubella TaxID=81985 RepID=R0EUH0_9BRAS|nr:F-box protein At5g62510 [Capsella rubella]EOA12762.1 hypothetical protein CARUB_v10028531mg [Capsella rubella]
MSRQCVNLPTIKSTIFDQEDERSVVYFLGHDPVLDQYKVVCTLVSSSEDLVKITSEHWVFVLEVGGSWKRIEFDQPHISTRPGLCISGVIYYLAFTSMSHDIVVSFDVRSEEFNIIQAPLVVSAFVDSVGFLEYGGKPAIIDHTSLGQNGLVDIWVLEDVGNWSRRSLSLQPCHIHLVDSNIEWTMEGATQNGEIILAPFELCSPFYILCYDLKKNVLRKVEIKGILDHKFSSLDVNLTLMDKSDSIVHLDT